MFQTPELIITDEIRDLLFTDKDCTPIRNLFIHKAYRRTEDLKKVQCPSCNSGVSGNKEGIKGCPYCGGAGYLWDEVVIFAWLFRSNLRTAISAYDMPAPVGRDDFKESRLLTDPDVFIFEGDSVFSLKVNKDKRIHIPVIRYEEYFCYFSERYASNQSDSEFNIAGLRV